MSLSFRLALRYLFSKKSHNAINIISAISVAGVALATLAMVCIMSVFNGFHDVIEGLYTTFDPEIKVIPKRGKMVASNDSVLQAICNHENVAAATHVLQDHALILFSGHPLLVEIKGVDNNFSKTSDIEKILRGGNGLVLQEGNTEYGIPGIALAFKICGSYNYGSLQICAPKKGERINMVNPAESFNTGILTSPLQVFVVNQPVYDENYFLTSLGFSQRLFDQPGMVTAVELRLKEDANLFFTKRELRKIAGDRFEVLDQMEQQADVYNIMNVEKLVSFAFLAFILFIAMFNIVGSLSMLIIEKREDMLTLYALGASPAMLRKIFFIEARLIALMGGIVGIILGVLLSLGQLHFEWITLGNGDGSFLIDAYPISIRVLDLIVILITVFLVSIVSTWFPVYYLTHRLIWKEHEAKAVERSLGGGSSE
jgi:lipoprotein-releasing system permease protein